MHIDSGQVYGAVLALLSLRSKCRLLFDQLAETSRKKQRVKGP